LSKEAAKNLILTTLPLTASYLLISFSMWLWYSLFGKYLVLDLGFRGEELGVAMMLYNLSYALSTLPSGRLSDLIDARKILSAGVAVYALGILLMAYSKVLPLIGVACVVAGLGEGVFFTSATVYAVKRGGVSRVGTIYGFVFSTGLLGEVLGALASGYVKEYLGVQMLFILSALTALIAAPFPLLLKGLQVGEGGSSSSFNLINLLKRHRGFRLMAVGLIFHGIGYNMIASFISVHAGELGLADTEIGLVNFTWLASMTATAMPWSVLTDRIGSKMILLGHVLFSSISWMAYATAWSLVGIICAAVFMGFVAAMDMPARRKLLAELESGEGIGALIGSLDMLTMLSSIPAPILGGMIYQASNLQILFLTASAVNLLGVPLLLRVRSGAGASSSR